MPPLLNTPGLRETQRAFRAAASALFLLSMLMDLSESFQQASKAKLDVPDLIPRENRRTVTYMSTHFEAINALATGFHRCDSRY